MKVCIKCNIGRDISEFSRRKSSKDGLNLQPLWAKDNLSKNNKIN